MALAISNLHVLKVFLSSPFKKAPLVEDYCVTSCENMMNLSADTSLTVCLSQLTWTAVVGCPWLVTGACQARYSPTQQDGEKGIKKRWKKPSWVKIKPV